MIADLLGENDDDSILMKEMRSKIKTALCSRYSHDSFKFFFHLGTLLDPWFHKDHLTPEEQVFTGENLKGMVSEPSIVRVNEETESSSSGTVRSSFTDSSNKRKASDSLKDLIAGIAKRTKCFAEQSELTKKEKNN